MRGRSQSKKSWEKTDSGRCFFARARRSLIDGQEVLVVPSAMAAW